MKACDLDIEGTFVKFQDACTLTFSDGANNKDVARALEAVRLAYKSLGCEDVKVKERE